MSTPDSDKPADDPKAGENQQNTDDNAAQTTSIEAMTQGKQAAGDDQRSKNQDDRVKPNKRDRLIQLSAVWESPLDLLFSACLVVFTFVQAIVGGCQWSAMEATNRYMSSQLDAMNEQNAEMVKQSNELIAQSKILKDQTDAMVKQIEVAQGQLRLTTDEQRAWIAMGDEIDVADASNPENSFATLKLVNSGNSPGAIVRQYAELFETTLGENGPILDFAALVARVRDLGKETPGPVVPPGEVPAFHVNLSVRRQGIDDKGARGRYSTTVLVVRIGYIAADGAEHSTVRCWNFESGVCVPYQDYCYID